MNIEFFFPFYPPVFTSHTQPKKETITTYNTATTNIYLTLTDGSFLCPYVDFASRCMSKEIQEASGV